MAFCFWPKAHGQIETRTLGAKSEDRTTKAQTLQRSLVKLGGVRRRVRGPGFGTRMWMYGDIFE